MTRAEALGDVLIRVEDAQKIELAIPVQRQRAQDEVTTVGNLRRAQLESIRKARQILADLELSIATELGR